LLSSPTGSASSCPWPSSAPALGLALLHCHAAHTVSLDVVGTPLSISRQVFPFDNLGRLGAGPADALHSLRFHLPCGGWTQLRQQHHLDTLRVGLLALSQLQVLPLTLGQCEVD
jgi:hypothetical protein